VEGVENEIIWLTNRLRRSVFPVISLHDLLAIVRDEGRHDDGEHRVTGESSLKSFQEVRIEEALVKFAVRWSTKIERYGMKRRTYRAATSLWGDLAQRVSIMARWFTGLGVSPSSRSRLSALRRDLTSTSTPSTWERVKVAKKAKTGSYHDIFEESLGLSALLAFETR
jgi:hypothetical protein